MFADTVMTLLRQADCFKFLLQRQERLVADRGQTCQWYSQMPRSMTSAAVVDQEVQRQAVKGGANFKTSRAAVFKR